VQGVRQAGAVMMKYNEEEQARLKHYIEPGRKDGRALWAVVRLNDKKIVGWYTTRSLAFLEWKRLIVAPRPIMQPVLARKAVRKISRPVPKPVIVRLLMPGMLECHKCKRICANKGDLYTHTCLGKKMVKLKPIANNRRSKLKKGWRVRGERLGLTSKQGRRAAKKRKRKAKKENSTYWRRMPGSGWAGRGQR
jgi:hypothetical protein